jgi:serpin B
VESQTNSLIKDLIPQGAVDALTILVLVSAIYFKGAWMHPFDVSDTVSDVSFHVEGGKKSKVKMMSQKEKFVHEITPSFSYVRLPYAGKNMAMDIFVPNGETTIASLIERNIFSYGFEAVRTSQDTVILHMPRFKLEYGCSLSDSLKKLGVVDAFGAEADFSNLANVFVLQFFFFFIFIYLFIFLYATQ